MKGLKLQDTKLTYKNQLYMCILAINTLKSKLKKNVIVQHKIKYLGINLRKHAQNFNAQNEKILRKNQTRSK